MNYRNERPNLMEPTHSNSILRRLRISTRFYASITSLLVLFLLAVGIACAGLVHLKNNIQRFADADKFATIIDRIDRDIIELQRDVLVFAAFGNASAPDRVKHVGQNLRDQIDQAQKFRNDEDTEYRLAEMRIRLDAYLDNFPTVIEERKTRQTLVQETLRELESETRPAFDELRQLLSIHSSVPDEPRGSDTNSQREGQVSSVDQRDAILLVERSMSSVALAQLKALRFFEDPDVAHVRDCLSLLSTAKKQISTIGDSSENAEIAVSAHRVVVQIEQYNSAFLRAVQATRGYMSLVNVVMAGEAAEFLYQSQQIQKNTLQRSQAISSETVSTAGQSTIAAIAFAVLALLVALLVTWMVARGIINPISAMTSTFSQLMRGKHEATIPGLERSDEIGEMARAADMFRDRTHQTEELLLQSQKLAQELDENAQQLARSNEDLNSFAYVASHDLRSPLRAIDNISSWIEEDVGDSIPDESKEHLGELRKRVRRMEQLLNELLDYSRVGQGDTRQDQTNLRTLIAETAELLDTPPDANVIVEGMTPIVSTDRGSLGRIILNLLSNAIKYRSERPLEIRCLCSVDHSNPEQSMATIRVSDNGIGIATEFQDRIFEMFKRLHRHDEIEGTGMGLALVKKIIQQAGGSIEVESEEHQGATFTFTWPVDVVKESSACTT